MNPIINSIPPVPMRLPTEPLISPADLTTGALENWVYLPIIAVLALCLVRELLRPWIKFPAKGLTGSYVNNIMTFLFNDTVLSLLSLPSLFYIAQHFSQYGLLNGVENRFLKWAASFILLDFAMYLWHVANHKYDLLWRFHKVHHSDPTLNATTALRFHLGELFLTVLVKASFIVLAGIEAFVLLLNEAILTSFVIFHHMNSSVPGEAWFGKLFVTPRFHRIHHSVNREEHDNNYGGVLTIWDHTFGTLREGEPEAIGLKNIAHQSFLDMIRFGLTPNYLPREAIDTRRNHRPHWRH